MTIDILVRGGVLPDGTRADIAEMRQRILDEHGSDDVWDLKHARGGLVEVEFIAQGLQLLHG